jgi:sulfate permease, SulP family
MAAAAAAPAADAAARTGPRPPRIELDRKELAGAVADIGVLIPIATALIVSNGLSATAVLLPAGLLYVVAALVYRLPVPVQPLKAFGAVAIAQGLGSDEIAAGALLMGVIFLVLGRTGLLDLAAGACPKALIRGVQLTVGLLFLKIAFELVSDPPRSFAAHALEPKLAVPLALGVAALALALRRNLVSLPLAAAGLAIALVHAGGELSFGPSPLALPAVDGEVLWTALTLLVIPQVPLTFANSCIATADAAGTYFGDAAERVRPGRLATTLGLANLFSGSVSGMPVCHGAGGMTAHQAFGARTGGAPLAIGAALLLLAVGAGAGLAAVLAAFPLPILAGMLAVVGLLHLGLLRDLEGIWSWTVALIVGLLGFEVNLALGLTAGLALWWLPRAVGRAAPQRALAQQR